MKFRVYHAYGEVFQRNMRVVGSPDNGYCPFESGGYEHVATVDVPSLAYVFKITQHVDRDWRLDKNAVVRCLRGPCRSTSVGDVVVDDHNNIHYRCMSFGWKQFSVE